MSLASPAWIFPKEITLAGDFFVFSHIHNLFSFCFGFLQFTFHNNTVYTLYRADCCGRSNNIVRPST